MSGDALQNPAVRKSLAKLVATFIEAGDFASALRTIEGAGVDVRDMLRSPEARRKARQRAGQVPGQRRDNVPDNVTTTGGTTAGHEPGQRPAEPSFPPHPPISPTHQDLKISSSLSPDLGSLEGGSGLEERAPAPAESETRPVTPPPPAAPPAPSSPSSTAPSTLTNVPPPELRAYMLEVAATYAQNTGRTIDGADWWDRFCDHYAQHPKPTADWRAAVRSWARNRNKYDAQDERSAKAREDRRQAAAPREIPAGEGAKRWAASSIKLADVLKSEAQGGATK